MASAEKTQIALNYFKKYQRDNRVQNTDETFSEGQVYTKAPLSQNRSRLLINYDLIDDGEAITPRKGYRTTEFAGVLGSTDLVPHLSNYLSITQGEEIVTEDAHDYKVLVANSFNPANIEEPYTGLYRAPAELWVIDLEASSDSYPMLNEYDIRTRGMYAIQLSHAVIIEEYDPEHTYNAGDKCSYQDNIYICIQNNTTGEWTPGNWLGYTYPQSRYTIPKNAEAHGIQITHPEYLARPVGCFAWDKNYYNFNTEGELIRSRYQVRDPEQGIDAPVFYTEKLTPKEVTVLEATNNGFNMLAENPYVFLDKYDGSTFVFQGISIYSGDRFITEPVLNTSYTLRCFYNVPAGTRYKLKWIYREKDTAVDQDIQEQDITFDSETPPALIAYNFVSPIENAIIRVEAYKWEPQYSAEAEATNSAYASVYLTTFKEQHPTPGTYTFTYTDGVWKDSNNNTINLSDHGLSIFPTAPTAGTVITVTLKAVDGFGDTPEKAISVGVTFVKIPSSTTANRELLNYDLSKATGMVYWKGYLWLYGVAQGPTVLFCSDINEPTYFPYPNNVDLFDEPILRCVPFNDSMLVFTKTAIHQITLLEEGGWTRKMLQGNLDFTEFSVRFAQVIRNMVFFKSGDYYYMIVPKKLSLQSELTVAPISKNIENMLDDFSNAVTDIFKILYDYEGEWELVNHYNFLNYEDIHNVYTFRVSAGMRDTFLNFVLLYNTVDRYWRTYVYESPDMYYPLRMEATKQVELMSPIYYNKIINGESSDHVGVQFLTFSRDHIKDFYIPQETDIINTEGIWKEDSGRMQQIFDQNHVIKNYTLLDSGYRDNTTDLKKRFREVQFKFNNTGTSILRFATEFLIDGETRVGRYKYEVDQLVDPSEPNFGLIYINRIPIENLEVPGDTILAKDQSDISAWTLNISRFPDVDFWKARLKVSGKGYTPRTLLISRMEEPYELLGYTWVYRLMYSR